MTALPRFAPLATFCLALAALTAPALAGGPTATATETPIAGATAPATSHDWSGLYLGLGLSKPGGSEAWYSTTFDGGYGSSASWKGNQGVLALGYNLQRGKMVYGVELSYSPGTIAANNFGETVYVQQCTTLYDGCFTEVSDVVKLGARVGSAFDRSLFYVSASWTSADVETGGLAPRETFLNDRLSGYSFGIGAEFAVSERMSLRAEYTRTQLEETSFDEAFVDSSTKPVFDTFTLGVNLSF